MLCNRLDTPYMFHGRTRLIIPDCISIRLAVLAQLTADSPYTLQCPLKRD